MPRQLTLAAWRKRRRLSQRDTADRLTAILGRPVRQQNVEQWESGVMPGGDVTEAIRKLTGDKVTGTSFAQAMPVSLKRIQGGGSVLLHVCEVCGCDAPFGVSVSMRLALKASVVGDLVTAKRLLGRWYCGEHRPAAGEAGA